MVTRQSILNTSIMNMLKRPYFNSMICLVLLLNLDDKLYGYNKKLPRNRSEQSYGELDNNMKNSVIV